MGRRIVLSGYKARIAYTFWWLRICLLRLFCYHEWDVVSDCCRYCKLTYKDLEDHTWKWRPMKFFAWRLK